MNVHADNATEPGDRDITHANRRTSTDIANMYLAGIGSLVHRDDVWRLTYDLCGHEQDLVSYGVEWESAAADVRRDYARCLICVSARPRQGIAPRLSLPKA